MALLPGIRFAAAAPAPPLGPTSAPEGLLLVGHGSRCVQGEVEMHDLAGLVAGDLPDTAVEVGFLEMTDPPAGVAIDRLVGRGCRVVTVMPVMLLGAGHAKSDVPAVILDARRRHPAVEFRFAGPFGVSRQPVELLGKAVVAAGGAGLPLLLVARGTSDPDANADAHKAARLVAEWTGAPFVHVGFSGVTGPTVPEAVDVFGRLGYPRLAVAWWFVCRGRLIERGRSDVAAVAGRYGIDVIDAGYLGPDPELARLIADRYHRAGAEPVAVACDTCAYRAPWPGREDRVGQPIGVGHSHLAAEHRHHRH